MIPQAQNVWMPGVQASEDTESEIRKAIIDLRLDRNLSEKENVDVARAKINEIFDRFNVPQPFRRGIIERLRTEQLPKFNKELKELAWKKVCLTATIDLSETWEKTISLQKPDGSLLYKLKNAVKNRQLMTANGYRSHEKESLDPVIHSFLICHDWAKAFSKAEDFEFGEWRPPYPISAFEFQLSGRRVIAVAVDDLSLPIGIFARASNGWIYVTQARFENDKIVCSDPDNPINAEVADICLSQIRAVSIAMDAGVAVSEIVRAPYKLNAARERRGELPLNAYHVVTLARQIYAPLPATDDEEKRRHPRLHFVRGHWRHLRNHKTWVRWHLRGNPDLGFIEKHYAL